MSGREIALSGDEFARLFPFHLAFDRELRLLSLGSSLARLLPEGPRGVLGDVVTIVRPRVCRDFASIEAHQRQVFILQTETREHASLRLRGQMVRLRDADCLVFVGSPWIEGAAQLRDAGLRLDDFAVHDSTGDMVHLMQLQLTALEESKSLASRLEQAKDSLLQQYHSVEKAEARTNAIVTSAVDGIITINASGVIQLFNRAAERIFGYEADEVVGRNVSMLMPAPHRDLHDGYIDRYRATGRATIIGVGREVPALRKDGSEFPCELSVSEARIGGEVQFVGIVRDITERRLAENQLIEATSRLSALIQNLDAGVVVEDETRTIVLVNDAFCRIFEAGAPPELLVGTSCARVMANASLLAVEPEAFAAGVADRVSRRERRLGTVVGLADGRVVSQDYIPIVTGEQFRGSVWLFSDVTDQVRSETALQASDARKSAILRNALDAIVTIDDEGHVLEWNPAAEALFGWRREEIVGKMIADHVLPEPARAAFRADLERARLTGESKSLGRRLLVELQRADGTVLSCDFTATRIDAPEGTGYTAFIRDASDRLRAVEKLNEAKELAERANQAKTQFLSVMSHEIRTPLNAILGMSELLSDSTLNREQTGYLATVRAGAEALLTLVNDFLDLSKIEAGQFDLDFSPFKPRELIEDVNRILRGRAALKNVALRTVVGDDVPERLIGDAARLRQILLNLGGNAVKFTERGMVELRLELVQSTPESSRIVMIVRDTGLGIAPEKQARIFDPFFQADQTVARRFGGTGLGLGISSALATQMEGRVWLQWSEPGKGSEFRFEVDLGSVPDTSGARTTSRPISIDELAEELSARRRPPMRVLVAEDNRENREIVERMLTLSGFDVDAVADGDAAVARYDRALHDLVLMDVEMPGSDGVAATAEIRAREKAEGSSQVPIVILSANVLQDVRQRCLEAGANAFLAKPIRKADLILAVEQWRDHRPAVLVVEDSAESRDVVVRFVLKSQRYRPCAVSGGEEALAMLERWEFAAVLLDLEMPGLDGFETVKAIRERFGRLLPVIGLSGHNDAATARRCLAAGFDRYLVKPVRRDDLIAALDEAIRREPKAPELNDRAIEVRIDPEIADLAEGYLANRRKEAGQLGELLESGDFDGIRRIGHNLKGSAGAYGFSQLGVYGAAIEAAAKGGDGDRIREQLAAIESYLARVVIAG